MRDAMVAALTLNIFNKHSDRIMMANIAQTVNVLQAMILTDAEKMVLTPTYYVFKMFKEHLENTSFIVINAREKRVRINTSDINLKKQKGPVLCL